MVEVEVRPPPPRIEAKGGTNGWMNEKVPFDSLVSVTMLSTSPESEGLSVNGWLIGEGWRKVDHVGSRQRRAPGDTIIAVGCDN